MRTINVGGADIQIHNVSEFGGTGLYTKSKYLSNVMLTYPVGNMVGEEATVKIKVARTSGSVPTTSTDHMREGKTLIPQAKQPNTVELQQGTDLTYVLEHHGLMGVIPKEVENDFDVADYQKLLTEQLTSMLTLEVERAIATIFTTQGNYASNDRVQLTGTDQWSDHTNSSPVDNLATALARLDTNGFDPTHIIMNRAVRTHLVSTAQFRTKTTYLVQNIGIEKAIETWFMREYGLKVLKADARYETAQQGQTSSRSRVWGNHCMIACIPSVGVLMPRFPVAYYHMGKMEVKKRFDPEAGRYGSTFIKVLMPSRNIKKVDMTAAYLIEDATA
jgi:hypothetical protein